MHLLDFQELAALAQAAPNTPCPACAPLVCPGWEAMPASFDDNQLVRQGSLQADGAEPVYAEYHPAGTRFWSADAPIAPGWHPYDRCGVWACGACGRAFLRYTEYGGYYVEPRIRALDAALLVQVPPPAA